MTVLAVLIGMVGFLAFKSMRTPAIALVALYCMFGLEQWAQANSATFVQNSTLINFMFAAVIGLALIAEFLRLLRQRKPVIQYYPAVGILVGVLLFYAYMTTLWTAPRVDTTLIWLSAIPYWLTSVVAGPLLFRKTEELHDAFAYQIVFGGIVAALLLFGAQWEGRTIVVNEDLVGYTQAGQGNPLATAEMAGVTIICATFAATSFRGGALLRLAVAAICMLVILRSGSRGQLLGLAGAIAVAFPIRYSLQHARVFVLTAVAGIFAVGVVLYGLAEYWDASGRFSGEQVTQDYGLRIEMAAGLLSVWLADTRAVAIGLGNSFSYDPDVLGSYPHVVPLEILAEEGLIGAVLYFAILVLVVGATIRAVKSSKANPQTNAAIAICVAIALYTFLLSLKQGSMLKSVTFFMSVIILAKACGLIRRRVQRATPYRPMTSAASGHSVRATVQPSSSV